MSNIKVIFHTISDITQNQNNLNNIQQNKQNFVITWFMASKGLREDWFIFFRDFIYHQIKSNSKFLLCDLSKWEKLSNVSLDKTQLPSKKKSKFRLYFTNCQHSELFSWIDGCYFFKYIIQCKNNKIINYIDQHIFTNQKLWDLSQEVEDLNVSIGRSLRNSAIIDKIADKDISKTYSVLQYLEGIYLCLHIILENLHQKDFNISFVLPNNENKYYIQETFQKDLQYIIENTVPKIEINNLTVNFIPFTWSSNINHRPYKYLHNQKLINSKNKNMFLLDSLFK